jgi:peroxiredoxin
MPILWRYFWIALDVNEYHKMKKILILVISILLLNNHFADGEGFNLKVVLPPVPGGQVLLAHYYGASILVDDTIRTDASGTGTLKRDTLLPQGIYKIYLNQDQHFDFLLGEDQHLLISNSDFTVQNMEIEGGIESVEFLKYMKWVAERQKERKLLEEKKSSASQGEILTIDEELQRINEEVVAYWKQKSAEYPGSFLGAFLMSNYFQDKKPEEFPEEYTANDSLKWVYHYNYRKNHYFEYFDLTDERLLYTPSVKQKLENYFERILLQLYDSVKPAAYQIIERIEPHPKMFRFVVSHLLNASLSSNVMGMDALFVDIARDFYLTGRASWADSTTLARIRENVIFLENSLVGKNARDFQMEAYDGSPFRLYQQNARFTILVFYEPNCSHCREYVPALYNDIYLPYRDKGVDVVAVYTMEDKSEWGDFIDKHHITEWHNVWDEHHVTRFKIIYDTRTTPQIYLLDKDKKIIAKKFTLDFLKNYMPRFLEDG